ncbi:oligosaccharide flippase family protein [Brevundimonas sp.]|uniref:oligosaccharide flippase family protein n=1 Tax=Brevundimonas sp. TaxID=1871086 RepID=UPI002D6691F7|nr:oligosaccharide flippase family protein [Brevundimonas sp.]HYC67394.1 oligosaccharide flippase family protein [Brevundimonas sp.]
MGAPGRLAAAWRNGVVAAGRLQRSSFLRSVAKLMSASALGQLTLLAAVPVLTRLYGPAAFAIYAVSSAVSIWAAVAASGRYSFAIVTADSDEESAAATALSLWVTLGFLACLLIAAGVWMAFGHAAAWAGGEYLTPDVLVWTVLGAIALGLTDIGAKWSVRRARFDILGWASFAGSALIVLLQIGIGLAIPAWGLFGLVMGQALGRLLATPIFLLTDFQGLRAGLKSSRRQMLAVARRYWRLPAYSVPSGFVNQTSKQLPALAFPVLGASVLGHYALCVRVLRGPLSFVSEAVGHVFFSRFTQLRFENDRAGRLYVKSLAGLFALSVPVSVIIILFGPPLFAFAFGEEWREAGHYAKLLLPLIIAEFMVGPTANVLQSYNRQGLLFAWTLWTAASTLLALLIVLPLRNPELAIATYSVVSFGNYFIYALICFYVIRARRTF